MDNRALLEEMGFFERDGWLCNPKLNGEAIFKINDPVYNFETADLKWLLAVITATASNSGSRWGRDNERANLARELLSMADELNGVTTGDSNDECNEVQDLSVRKCTNASSVR
jgi:hypothetical protein